MTNKLKLETGNPKSVISCRRLQFNYIMRLGFALARGLTRINLASGAIGSGWLPRAIPSPDFPNELRQDAVHWLVTSSKPSTLRRHLRRSAVAIARR
jgi:hypothetical protein